MGRERRIVGMTRRLAVVTLFVALALPAGDDSAGEAALAIAGTHSAEGFHALRECLEKVRDPWFRSVLLSAIALTRQDMALEFLLDLIRTESLDAEPAIEAVVRSMPSGEVVHRLEKLVGHTSPLFGYPLRITSFRIARHSSLR